VCEEERLTVWLFWTSRSSFELGFCCLEFVDCFTRSVMVWPAAKSDERDGMANSGHVPMTSRHAQESGHGLRDQLRFQR
jgi:hypothetical protein